MGIFQENEATTWKQAWDQLLAYKTHIKPNAVLTKMNKQNKWTENEMKETKLKATTNEHK